MNILFFEWKSYCVPDMIEAFETFGHHVDLFSCQEMTDRYSSTFPDIFFGRITQKHYDFVFTFNYFPIVSDCCDKHQIPYVSWVYDNPLVALYSCSVIHACNYIFLFDYNTYQEFHNQGIETVYYLPLCTNPNRLRSSASTVAISNDVSFVGSLYNEPRQALYERLSSLDAYTKGYLDALVDTQAHISGYFFLEKALTPTLINNLKKAYPVPPNKDGAESEAYLYANYFLGRKATAIERHDLLKKLSEHAHVTLYTHTSPTDLPHVSYAGKIDYYDTMPSVFAGSKINLNITLKTIQTGIPLRAWDILGCGGFLLSNYQEEFLQYFVPNEDFVYYESADDAIEKVEYYLSHEKERVEIAQNGWNKVNASHTFLHRVQAMLEIVR